MPVSLTIRRILSVYPIDLPVFHPIAIKLQHLLQSSEFDMEDVISLASQDQVMATRVLRIANSPAYRGSAPVETMKDAVVRLGAQSVANIAMAASQASMHLSENEVINRYMRKLWQHSHACAIACRWTANVTGLRRLAEQAYLGGLLHDIGKLYLLKVLEKLSATGVAKSALDETTLREVFLELHVEEGAKLMQYWDLPPVYRGVVERHHEPQCQVGDMVLLIVRLVNEVARKTGVSLNPDQHLDLSMVKEAGLVGLGAERMKELEHVLEEARAIVV